MCWLDNIWGGKFKLLCQVIGLLITIITRGIRLSVTAALAIVWCLVCTIIDHRLRLRAMLNPPTGIYPHRKKYQSAYKRGEAVTPLFHGSFRTELQSGCFPFAGSKTKRFLTGDEKSFHLWSREA